MIYSAHAPQRRWVSLALVAMTLFVYAPVVTHDFINLDDQTYVLENPHVRDGLTWENVRWAFTEAYASNWHPLTWLSHMLDCEWFGSNPGEPHLVNLLLHLANTVLLFLVLARMTRETGPSAFVAALFALHPLHVESVAWVAERKDVLSGLFWMLTIWAYVHYAERTGIGRYLLVLLFFVLGLLSKPMLVTLPFVLLLLDVWPLRRTGPVVRWWVEKIPFLLCSAGSSLVTFWAQQRGGAIVPASVIPISDRIGSALVACAHYIGAMFWPANLAVYYPRTGPPSVWAAVTIGLWLLACSLFVIAQRKQRPYLGVGWFWFLGTLVPVLGLVRVGGQAWADRYTYLPLIGLFLIVAWGAKDLAKRWLISPVAIQSTAAAVILLCAGCAWLQLRHWQDSVTLFQRALRVTRDNSLAHFNLGCALYERGQADDAVTQFLDALRIEPTYAKARYNLETILGEGDRSGLKPARLAFVHNQLGILYAQQAQPAKALVHFEAAVRFDPGNAMAHFNLGLALQAADRRGEAVEQYREAVRLQPNFTDARARLRAAGGD